MLGCEDVDTDPGIYIFLYNLINFPELLEVLDSSR